MMFKRFFILSILCASAALASGQPMMSSSLTEVDLGRVKSNDPVVVRIPIQNTGNKKLEIRDIKTSCGCVKPEMSQMTIKPGKTQILTIRFNTDIIGYFTKFVDVYSNAKNSPLLLTLYGTIVDENTRSEYERMYPYKFKEDLLLSHHDLDFGVVEKGEKKEIAIRIYNGSDNSYTPNVLHLPEYCSISCQPTTLHKGRVGILTVTLDTDKVKDYGLTQEHTCLSQHSGDKHKAHENELPLSFTLVPKSETSANPPVCKSLASIIADNDAMVPLHNVGGSPLQILAVQPLNKAIQVKLSKKDRIVAPGQSVPLNITYKARKQDHGPMQILVITNDPAQPQLRIDVVH